MLVQKENLNKRFDVFEDTIELHTWLVEFLEDCKRENYIDSHSQYMLTEVCNSLQGLYHLAYSFRHFHNK